MENCSLELIAVFIFDSFSAAKQSVISEFFFNPCRKNTVKLQRISIASLIFLRPRIVSESKDVQDCFGASRELFIVFDGTHVPIT